MSAASPAVPATVWDLLLSCAERSPDAIALTDESTGESVSYGQLRDRAARLSTGLAELGVQRGDRLAMWLPNSIEWVALAFAAGRLGVLAVPLNPRYKVHEVSHLLEVAQARVLVFAPGFHDIDFGTMVDNALDEPAAAVIDTIVTVGEPGAWANRHGKQVVDYAELSAAGEPYGAATGQPQDPFLVFGTSGTTSFPKLAQHDQQSVARHAVEAATTLGYGSDEVTLCFLPFCGAYGFIVLSSLLAACGRAVIMPVYQRDRALEVMAREGVTGFFALESVVRALLDAPGLDRRALQAWNKGGIAGVSAEAVVERAERELGVRLTNLYGSSEIFAMMACWDLSDPVAVRAVAGGRLMGDDMHVRAVDPANGTTLADGESGELEFSGYNVTCGYLANPAADAKAFTEDGWYRTGDWGSTLENGRAVHYEARLADTLRLHGYLVNPTEIENLIVEQGLVSEVQVVGVPNAATGEEQAVAFVIAEPDDALEDRIRGYCRAQAASWKIPDAVIALAAFPMTPGANGDKVQKGALREFGAKHLAERGLLG